MAHVLKVKAAGMPAMVAHYARTPEMNGYHRPNIDPSRTRENYAIGADSPEELAREVAARVRDAEARHRSLTGRKVRRDANLLADWVITLPADCPPEMEGRFFAAVLGFVRDRYGAENVPGAFVHLDESRPHVHVPVVPVTPDGRLCAKEVVDRNDLKSFHGDLSACVDRELGVHVSVLLDADARAEKALSDVKDHEALTIMSAQAAHDRDVAASARREAALAGREMVKAQDQATRAQVDADRARADARAAQVEADRAKADAQAARGEAMRAREDADRAKADAESARSRADAARASEAESNRALSAARADAARARREAESAKAQAAKARSDAARAKDELAGIRAQLAAVQGQLAEARAELARVRSEIDRVMSRAKAKFRSWWRSLEREPDIDSMAHEAARAMADAIREAGLADPDRDAPCR